MSSESSRLSSKDGGILPNVAKQLFETFGGANGFGLNEGGGLVKSPTCGNPGVPVGQLLFDDEETINSCFKTIK
jgi:hypothetical protein